MPQTYEINGFLKANLKYGQKKNNNSNNTLLLI